MCLMELGAYIEHFHFRLRQTVKYISCHKDGLCIAKVKQARTRMATAKRYHHSIGINETAE